MKKNGFTIIEIIICLALLSIVSTITIIGSKSVIDKNKSEQINKNNKLLTSALEVYLTNNESIEKNLLLNSKAAVVTLDSLKDQGLIKDDLIDPSTGKKYDYSKSFFTLLEAQVLDNDDVNDETIEQCEYNTLSIEVIKSWDLSKYDSKNVIYICPRKDFTKEIEDLQKKVNDLTSEVNDIKDKNNSQYGSNNGDVKQDFKINSLFDDLTYTAKGSNPNNYVEFEVNSDSSKIAYFENDRKNIWRIVTIDSLNQIQLIHEKAALSNNNLNYTTITSTWCDSGIKDYSNCTFHSLKHNAPGLYDSKYYVYDNNQGWYVKELLEDVDSVDSKKASLFNAIVNNSWIISKRYFPQYNINSSGTITFASSQFVDLKMGMVNINEINSSINISDSWLFNYNMLLGYIDYSQSFDDYYFYAYNTSSTLNKSRSLSVANRCTNSQCTRDKDSTNHYYIKTFNYFPVITLNSKVKLVEPSCSDGAVKGSINCPYKLSCDDC